MTAFFINAFVILIMVGMAIFICCALSMVLFSTVKLILELYYSLIKRTILLFGMRRRLKKATVQSLWHYKTEGRGQNGGLATEFSALSFKQSLKLSRKDTLIIFSIVCVVSVFFVCGLVIASVFTKFALVAPQVASGLFFIGALPLLWILVLSTFTLPVILILHSFLHYGVKKTVKRLETFA
ncbi:MULTISPECIES: hypothetical protein [unclassified Bartonella]|uniref:hypothetical protein n=1 Tax=unclassified Bartonella TaxID=2645622 RepID=UPI0035D063EE